MTRRAYLAQLLRVIRWQGAASLKMKIKRQLEDFWPQFVSVWEVCKFVLQFDNFPREEKWNDEHMQRESSGARRNDEFIGRYLLIFFIIFVTSCYVLNKILILSENSNARAIWDHPRAGNPARKLKLTVKRSENHWNWENQKIEKNSAKLQETSIFQCLKYIFALLTQQIIKIRDPGARERIEWLVELIWLSS